MAKRRHTEKKTTSQSNAFERLTYDAVERFVGRANDRLHNKTNSARDSHSHEGECLCVCSKMNVHYPNRAATGDVVQPHGVATLCDVIVSGGTNAHDKVRLARR